MEIRNLFPIYDLNYSGHHHHEGYFPSPFFYHHHHLNLMAKVFLQQQRRQLDYNSTQESCFKPRNQLEIEREYRYHDGSCRGNQLRLEEQDKISQNNIANKAGRNRNGGVEEVRSGNKTRMRNFKDDNNFNSNNNRNKQNQHNQTSRGTNNKNSGNNHCRGHKSWKYFPQLPSILQHPNSREDGDDDDYDDDDVEKKIKKKVHNKEVFRGRVKFSKYIRRLTKHTDLGSSGRPSNNLLTCKRLIDGGDDDGDYDNDGRCEPVFRIKSNKENKFIFEGNDERLASKRNHFTETNINRPSGDGVLIERQNSIRDRIILYSSSFQHHSKTSVWSGCSDDQEKENVPPNTNSLNVDSNENESKLARQHEQYDQLLLTELSSIAEMPGYIEQDSNYEHRSLHRHHHHHHHHQMHSTYNYPLHSTMMNLDDETTSIEDN